MNTSKTTHNAALSGAAARLRRILTVSAAVLVVAEALWCAVGGARGAVARPLGTFPVAAVSTTALLASNWWVLVRMIRSGVGLLVAWMTGGYLGKVTILAIALLGGRALGLDVKVIGLSLIAAILTGMFMEATVLA